VLFLFSAILILFTFSTLSSISNTLNRLNVVEAERDRWQRPSDVLRSLSVSEGSVVVDLGSGAGYFTVRLAPVVGRRGEVIAVDLRRPSVFFLRIRALLRNQHNISIIVGTPDDPHLPAGRIDAVLISNTYHEFTNPRLMLDHTWRALRFGGRLVVIDRSQTSRHSGEDQSYRHELPPEVVVNQLHLKGFEILERQDRFIDRPTGELWWLIVAKKSRR
jgi:ubiquinone/menaquinone biosynthesis C-methylase UbiE